MRQPVDRVADHLDVRHRRPATSARIRSTSADSRAASAAASARTARSAAAAATTAGSVRDAGRAAALPLVGRHGDCPAGALADHQHARPRAGRPTCARWPVSSDQPAGTGQPARPTGPRRRSSGTPRSRAGRGRLGHRLHGADLVVGADQAGQGHARAADRGGAGGQVDPAEPVDRHAGRRRRRPRRAARRRAARRVLDRRVHERRRRRGGARPGRRARPAWRGLGAAGAKVSSSGRTPSTSAIASRARVEQLPGPAGRRVELGRVGPAVVERGQQRLRARPDAAAPRSPRPEVRPGLRSRTARIARYRPPRSGDADTPTPGHGRSAMVE